MLNEDVEKKLATLVGSKDPIFVERFKSYIADQWDTSIVDLINHIDRTRQTLNNMIAKKDEYQFFDKLLGMPADWINTQIWVLEKELRELENVYSGRINRITGKSKLLDSIVREEQRKLISKREEEGFL